MTKRERRYHYRIKVHRTLVNELTEKIRETIDAEIIETLKKVAVAIEYGFENDLIPFASKPIYK